MKNIKTLLACAGIGALAVTNALCEDLSQLISPVTNPLQFEDPRNSTEIRPIYMHHVIDKKFVTGGGDVNVYAVQARYAVSDDFSVIATKDGYIDFNPKGTLQNDEGTANIEAGFKYTIARCDNYITSVGLRYEIPTGEKEVLQGQGDGSINPFVSTAYIIDNLNLMGSTGFRIAVDEQDSSFYDLNLHASYKIGNFYPLAELGVTTVVSAGDRLPIASEGEDLLNLGASKSEGQTLVTGAIGARYRLADNIDIGAAYQIPLDRGDGSRIIEHRVTTDLIYRF